MKLPFNLPLGKKEQKDYFLALLLRNEKVTAVIFEEVAGKVHVVGEHEAQFPQAIDTLDTEALLTTLDVAISKAEEHLPNNVVTRKTIFGVKETWVADAKIKHEYLAKLKKVSDTLGLTPIGFLVIHEAITHLLQKEEGAPVSAILVEVEKKQLVVSYLRAGKILETQTTTLDTSVPETVDKLLHHFSYEVLPSRIILFNGGDEEKLSQAFISHSWSKTLPFLHVPQITPLPKGFDAKAVLFGAATQMGFEMLPQETDESKEKSRPMAEVAPEENEKDEKTEEPENNENVEHIALHEGTPSFGFVKEEDIHKKQQKTEDSPTEAISSPEPIQEESNVVPVETALPGIHFSKKNTPPQLLQMQRLLSTLFNNLRQLPFVAGLGKGIRIPSNKKIIVIPPVLLVLLISGLLLYIFGLKATVTLGLSTKSIEKEQDVTFVDGGQSTFSDGILAGHIIEVTEEETGSIDTTGKKEIGDKAKGQVTLYSRFTQEKTLPSGTAITASNGIVFTFDDSVKLASAAAGASAQPVTVKVNITAKNIGKESNLPSGAKFTINGYDVSEIEGKNDGAFSGGSKKEVTVVAKADQDALSKDLPKKAEEKAKEDARKQLKEGESLVATFIETSLSQKEFSKDIGEEASSVQLKATITYKTIAFKESDLQILARKVFEENLGDMIPAGDGIAYDVKEAEKASEKEIKTKLLLKANLIPKIDRQALQKKIAATSFTAAEQLLKETPQVKSVNIVLQPNLFFLPKTLPRQSQQIFFVIDANE